MSSTVPVSDSVEASGLPPCVVHEDESLLVVHKPAGWNTHAPSPYAGEGIYEWLRHREPRWATLSILHRLDKETSGLLVFGKTPAANRSLTAQFTEREIGKHYLLVTDRPVERDAATVTLAIRRDGARYLGVPPASGGDPAETQFRVLRREAGRTWIDATPKTGRTHQIRVHVASLGWPILGDELYGGTRADRVYLHARQLTFDHPETGQSVTFEAPAGFESDAGASRLELRRACVNPIETDAFRRVHGAADGEPEVFVDQLGEWLLIQSEEESIAREWWSRAQQRLTISPSSGAENPSIRGVYFKRLNRHVRATTVTQACPTRLDGEEAPAVFHIRENGLRYELSFAEGYSVGIFLDQRDNRRRVLRNHVAAEFPLSALGTAGRELLNCFAYTCGFSVAAAAGGFRTTSLDLSRKYLDWGRRNFEANGLPLDGHDFIYGDVFDWLRRLGKKGRRYNVVILDPPTFSRSKEHGDFRAESDYGSLVSAALKVLNPGGVLLASTNALRLEPERFLAEVSEAVAGAGRRIQKQHYIPQGVDFPISREEPAYLKTAWFRIS